MIKLFRIAAYFLDMVLAIILAFEVCIVSFLWLPNISTLTYKIIFFCLVALFLIIINLIFSNKRSLFQELFGIEVHYNNSLADKKMCLKKNIIDFLTFTVGFFTIILYNNSIGDIILDTTVVETK